ncbi:hypothetical protein CI238_03202, partial [Colletotrichum incanum]
LDGDSNIVRGCRTLGRPSAILSGTTPRKTTSRFATNLATLLFLVSLTSNAPKLQQHSCHILVPHQGIFRRAIPPKHRALYGFRMGQSGAGYHIRRGSQLVRRHPRSVSLVAPVCIAASYQYTYDALNVTPRCIPYQQARMGYNPHYTLDLERHTADSGIGLYPATHRSC